VAEARRQAHPILLIMRSIWWRLLRGLDLCRSWLVLLPMSSYVLCIVSLQPVCVALVALCRDPIALLLPCEMIARTMSAAAVVSVASKNECGLDGSDRRQASSTPMGQNENWSLLFHHLRARLCKSNAAEGWQSAGSIAFGKKSTSRFGANGQRICAGSGPTSSRTHCASFLPIVEVINRTVITGRGAYRQDSFRPV
jgi:hypothetical protein